MTLRFALAPRLSAAQDSPMILRALLSGLPILVLPFTLQALAQTAFEQDCATLASTAGNDTARLHQLFDLHWKYTMQENPEFATGGLISRWPRLKDGSENCRPRGASFDPSTESD